MRRRRRIGGRIRLELERLAVVLLLFELLQLLDVQERLQIVLHVLDLVYVDGAVRVDHAAAVLVRVVQLTRARRRHAHLAARRRRRRRVVVVVC